MVKLICKFRCTYRINIHCHSLRMTTRIFANSGPPSATSASNSKVYLAAIPYVLFKYNLALEFGLRVEDALASSI